MPIAASFCRLAKRDHELGAVYPALQRKPTEPCEPDKWHPIRHNEVGIVKHTLKPRILVCFHDSVHPSDCNVMASLVTLNPLLHLLDDIWNLNGVDTHP